MCLCKECMDGCFYASSADCHRFWCLRYFHFNFIIVSLPNICFHKDSSLPIASILFSRASLPISCHSHERRHARALKWCASLSLLCHCYFVIAVSPVIAVNPVVIVHVINVPVVVFAISPALPDP